eukprot:TRINITY_DN8908_c0_g1_i1.p1 TRINITY_DN8908_c0_g1~~TRINITY_DN8908_c0_g1_i1.p1  ORF type:complete len:315 (+),score=53.03 TRINITY_DN8908_c0_g1_i1:95-946(+)
MDLNLTDKLVDRAATFSGPLHKKTVIEVGPGPGPLTRSILKAGCKNLILVEKDPRFLPALNMLKEAAEGKSKVTIVQGDILDVDEEQLLDESQLATKKAWEDPSDVLIVGNLPFAVATELLLKWIRQIHRRAGAFAYGRAGMALMFQKEVAHRIVAQPGSKEYNRLSVMTQHCATANLIFDIGRKNFVPQPEVDAGVVYIEPLVKHVRDVDIVALEKLCSQVFTQKRKIVSNSIKTVHSDAGVLLELTGIDPTLRPEEIPVSDWCLLANVYKNSVFYKKKNEE